jgi:hypothetical protein
VARRKARILTAVLVATCVLSLPDLLRYIGLPLPVPLAYASRFVVAMLLFAVLGAVTLMSVPAFVVDVSFFSGEHFEGGIGIAPKDAIGWLILLTTWSILFGFLGVMVVREGRRKRRGV